MNYLPCWIKKQIHLDVEISLYYAAKCKTYDVPITNAPQPQPTTNHKSIIAQQQVNEVVNIMRDNISRAMDRGEKLDSLTYKASDVEKGSIRFKQSANQTRKRMWWGNMKIRLMIAAIIIGILVCIIATIVVKTNYSQNSKPALTQSA
ncbi:Vesicle membrane receptor protein (v-SNARE) [Basidiobolus ranarum]|uniref:Vesicle membrane receptor protein (V-SNARE) n=1 Tax=Basidiobolus ranarum TaxID=34480 RepID=A0ABR2W2E6_9FUNG